MMNAIMDVTCRNISTKDDDDDVDDAADDDDVDDADGLDLTADYHVTMEAN